MVDNIPKYTPIEKIDGVYVKRDDLYRRAGCCGGKVRACYYLATRGTGRDGGLITASARRSPQAQIVARLATYLGREARCHMPTGKQTEEMQDVVAHGGTIIQHRAGYNNVIIARAKADYAARPGWRYIPFGMEDPGAVRCTREQVANIPREINRIVIPIGSGMSAAGVLHGLRDRGLDIPVLGIRVGANPTKRLDTFAPFGWRAMMSLVDVTPTVAYHKPVTAQLGGLPLDPIYEAKCLEYLHRNDLFWVVGRRVKI